MPRTRRKGATKRQALSREAYAELSLGPKSSIHSEFASDEERRRVWQAYRAEILSEGIWRDGRMPWAAEQYDRPQRRGKGNIL